MFKTKKTYLLKFIVYLARSEKSCSQIQQILSWAQEKLFRCSEVEIKNYDL